MHYSCGGAHRVRRKSEKDMGALSPLSAWTSEDDQLIKNAVEVGTSLESLCKGAIQFSRRFTFQELKDRWNLLTCNADVSVKASPPTIESVDSPNSHILKHKDDKSVRKKRMNEGARDCYNPMLKRIKSEVADIGGNLQSTDNMHGDGKLDHYRSPVSKHESVPQHLPHCKTLNSAAATAVNVTESCKSTKAHHLCNPNKFIVNSHNVAKEVNQPSNMSVSKRNDGSCPEVQIPVKSEQVSINNADTDINKFGQSPTLPDISTQNTSKSVSKPAFPEVQVKEEKTTVNFADSPSDDNAYNSEFFGCNVRAYDQIPCNNMEDTAPSTDGHLARSHDSFMDLKQLEEFLFSDIDIEDTDSANIPDLDSFLNDFTRAGNLSNAGHSSTPEGGACSMDVVSDGKHMVIPSYVPSLPSLSPEDPDLPALRNGVICCSLNSEDTEIPCNDDVLLSSRNNHHQVRGLITCNAAENSDERPNSCSQTIKSQILAQLGINLPFINPGS